MGTKVGQVGLSLVAVKSVDDATTLDEVEQQKREICRDRREKGEKRRFPRTRIELLRMKSGEDEIRGLKKGGRPSRALYCRTNHTTQPAHQYLGKGKGANKRGRAASLPRLARVERPALSLSLSDFSSSCSPEPGF